MPSSGPFQLNEIVEMIMLTQPDSMLDVGIGFGKYGFLAREYLELWDGRNRYGDWRRRIDGIEIFPDYVGPLQSAIYDEIHIGDALAIMSRLDRRYDLVLMVDVLEHVPEDHGREMLAAAFRIGRNVIVSTPLDIGHQGSVFENPHETHHFQWTRAHFQGLAPGFFVPNRRSLIWYGGEAAARVKAGRLPASRWQLELRRHRARLQRSTRGVLRAVLRGRAVRAARRRLARMPGLKAAYMRLRALNQRAE